MSREKRNDNITLKNFKNLTEKYLCFFLFSFLGQHSKMLKNETNVYCFTKKKMLFSHDARNDDHQ
jgi:hypothetical protein